MQHLLVTTDFLPELDGAARRYTALARHFPEPMIVSTVSAPATARQDLAEDYAIERQPFPAERAGSFANRMRWRRWIAKRSRGRIHVLHASDICLTGRLVWRAHKRLRTPYVVYVTAGSLARARGMVARGVHGRRVVRLVMGDAAGVIATTEDVATEARELMVDVRISAPAPVAATGVGTDPALFGPGRDSGALRARWGIRRAPIVLTVARLVPHKGQDTGIAALALLRDEFPDLRYVLVGEGPDEVRLRNLAADLNVMDRVGFAGPMRDDELPEAYATSTVYLDASRDAADDADGLGISILEAAAAGLPVVTGRDGGVRSSVRNRETGMIVDSVDPESIAEALAALLGNAELRSEMGMSGRESAEARHNWNRVAHDTARFVRECVANG